MGARSAWGSKKNIPNTRNIKQFHAAADARGYLALKAWGA